MKKFFYLSLIIFVILSSCGRKGALEPVGEQKRPKFDNVVEEE
jgi:hypothetical protein